MSLPGGRAAGRVNEADLIDRATVAFSRAVTRRTFIRRTLGAALVAGASLSNLTIAARPAGAHSCNKTVSNWGCYCASTPTCAAYNCTSGGRCTYKARARCHYWPTYPHSWCSVTCCIAGGSGHFECTDCWQFDSGRDCNYGKNPCICKKRWVHKCC